MSRPSSRERIIEAAEAVIARSGAAHLTLDAVAREAGISKGGLLYHFSTKRELLQAIVVEFGNAKFEALESQRRLLHSENAPLLETNLKAALQLQETSNRELGVALLAAIANDPTLLTPITERFDEFLDQIWNTEGEFNADAALLWLAAEGLKFFNLFALEPLKGDRRQIVQERILALAREVGRGNSLKQDPASSNGPRQKGAGRKKGG